MGGGEGLVQVQVQHIEAHVRGAHLAEDGIQVGAVVVEQAAGVMHHLGDLNGLPFEDAAGRRVGHHQAGGLRAYCGFQGVEVHVAVAVHRHFPHGVAAHHRRRRIGAMGGVGSQDFAALKIASGAMVGADHGHPGELALGAGHGRQRHRRHAGDFLEELLQGEQALHEALAGPLRRQRMTA